MSWPKGNDLFNPPTHTHLPPSTPPPPHPPTHLYSTKERAILLRGHFENIEKAEREVIDLLLSRRQKQADAKAAEDREKLGGKKEEGEGGGGKRKTLRWLIPGELSGLLIGKKVDR